MSAVEGLETNACQAQIGRIFPTEKQYVKPEAIVTAKVALLSYRQQSLPTLRQVL
ncbi:MAG: hypothetical protein RBJ76_11150 [Stenomitos frigidus ULC029]